jgi:glycosyltransferase involved in cell wall biosynthesis
MNSVSKNNPNIVIVMPAYNAAKTVRDTYAEIPPKYRKHIILVDDHSTDGTVSVAKKLGITVFEHSNNLGYGGNQKTCYWEALKLNPDIVVMLHPDYQYDASMIEELIQPIAKGRYDFMFGSRIANKRGALKGGMPPVKYYVNRLVGLIQNVLLGVNFTEHFSGFRAYSGNLLRTVPFQRFSDDFVFDQEMTISSINYGFRIGEIAIPTRYHDKASSIKFLKGTKFILEGFATIGSYFLFKAGLINDRRFASKESK